MGFLFVHGLVRVIKVLFLGLFVDCGFRPGFILIRPFLGLVSARNMTSGVRTLEFVQE